MNKLKSTLVSFAIGVLLMAAPVTILAQCPGVLIIPEGKGSYSCYLIAESPDYCYYDCYYTESQ